MPNTAMQMINDRQLLALDNHIYEQAKIELVGRSLFKNIQVPRYTQAYGYEVYESTGKARRSGPTGRNTDTPVGDETKHSFYVPMTQWEFAIEYSDDDLGLAQAVGDSGFITRRGNQAARAMAEYEDKVIFNGSSEDGINGLTGKIEDTGFKELKPANGGLDSMTPEQILDYFKTASHLITDLGYSNTKPILLITTEVETKLDTFYNEYRDNTIEDYVSKYFSQIKVAKELEKKFTGRKGDLGLVFLNDEETAGIPTAIPLERTLNQHLDNRTKIKYREKFGGVAVRYPSHFVQLPGLTK